MSQLLLNRIGELLLTSEALAEIGPLGETRTSVLERLNFIDIVVVARFATKFTVFSTNGFEDLPNRLFLPFCPLLCKTHRDNVAKLSLRSVRRAAA